ncbi:hypothetical protein BDV3_000717 [Batrachochytrium dendrobatidis]
MLMVQSGQPFPESYIPTVFENYISKITLSSGKTVELSLWDTAGQEDYDRIRPLSYPDTDVAIMTFAINDPSTLDNIRDRWDPETKHFLPGVPRILVGSKADIRKYPEPVIDGRIPEALITYEEGVQMMHQIGALKYFECSAKTGEGIKEVFTTAAKLAVKQRKKAVRCKVL